ncbi:hypothetical protein R0K17_00400 [Planococcus sp. SIMBA_143]
MKQEHHHHHGADKHLPEVFVNTSYNSGIVTVEVRNADGLKASLAETHEKRMHLVIVSADLETFVHVHPVENDSGNYEVELALSDGKYFSFADINPVDMTYSIKPVPITVGEITEVKTPNWQLLKENDRSIKEIGGKTVGFEHPPITAGKPVVLSFDLHGESPLPYLGALGHVVVLNEDATQFIHVHPASEDVPEFEAQFPFPGFYKLWVEFKFADSGVLAFPFIVEVS